MKPASRWRQIFNAEMKDLVAAGARNHRRLSDLGAWLPLFTNNKDDYKWIADTIAQCIDGVNAKIRMALLLRATPWGMR